MDYLTEDPVLKTFGMVPYPSEVDYLTEDSLPKGRLSQKTSFSEDSIPNGYVPVSGAPWQ